MKKFGLKGAVNIVDVLDIKVIAVNFLLYDFFHLLYSLDPT